jgi:YgiT-type zinc finger domain-containing protein
MYCQAEMKKSTAPFHIDRKGCGVATDEVPAWVCPQCGESYCEEQEKASMQALVKAVEEQTKKLGLYPNLSKVNVAPSAILAVRDGVPRVYGIC